MTVNKTLVRRRLAFIQDQHAELAQMKELPSSEFLSPRNLAAAESFLRRSLEAVFDVGRHILAKTGRGELAQEYKSIAEGLGLLGVVSEPLAAKLLVMAGYRNRLVHLYYEITPEELHHIIGTEADGLMEFVGEIQRFLDQE